MTKRPPSLACAILCLLPLQGAAQMVEPPAQGGADTAPYVRAALPLDEPRHLCIDLPGHGDQVDLAGAFTVHTCKDGMWNLDQRFEWVDGNSRLRMPQYDRCLAADPQPGADILLADCSAETAVWQFENARLKHRQAPALCVTIADERSELTPGGQRFETRARARSLSLEPCDESAIERQLWTVTQPLALESMLLPPSGSLPLE
ncbi:RICIN domain-containing protein [Vannielia litorea]|uniref:Ricin-type beta-trefoil lectin domain-containing protein n=1 Tax=Vannielia litorea TaxID=1217970 RepID=A0A1N6GHV3_9RHOB|nr:RICIN domain-containing protein [Vannielia litorea]SIO07118.1 Ricin-type beta-trefoil lectin domain-containing protein [Vannielia litorea]